MDKTLIVLKKEGPAFSAQEIAAAHLALDRIGAPRKIESGRDLNLPERIFMLEKQILLNLLDHMVAPERAVK